MGRAENLVKGMGFILSAVSFIPSGHCEEHRWRRWEWVEVGQWGCSLYWSEQKGVVSDLSGSLHA